ncbi:oligosaccharide flippase family protein [Methanothermobacter thermautotrophicus]|uniref:oligosaccharide flippase family protein n=1 Tax=Methanothermobacter thermautotrophicus TaxID=145262 RepID=UPI0022B8EF33|nr:oligosaccharide flippase family protein [Methanothermobacter thermautotrophicus]MDI6818597.1 oligosaccharide flippase family protein [Methanothermobacter thermautotrophicus]WBF06660.1 oligosaccharide flippase family protein [Methanothermobacter thermautotrophicus]WBF08458.1 oligosaccharide flippase family protein [Methanothermobacter thermautotrophicus]
MSIRDLMGLIRSEEYRVLAENFLSLSTLQVLVYIIPFITLPYLTRVLGVYNYGLVNFAIAFNTYFIIITDYGFNLSAVREISVNREDPHRVSEIFSSVMLIKGILATLSFCILLLVILNIPRFSVNWQVYTFAFGLVIGNVIFPTWFYQGMERMKYITVLNVLTNLIFLAAIFIFIRRPSDYLYVPLLQSMGTLTAGVISQWIIRTRFNVRFHLPPLRTVYETFRDSTQFFLSRVSVSIYTSSNSFFLGLFAGNTAVGYYSAAEKLYTAAQGLYSPLMQVTYPYMAKTRNRAFHKKVLRYSLILNTILCGGIILFAPTIIGILFGPQYMPSVNVLRLLAVALMVVIPSILLGYPFLAVLGQQRYANGSVIIGSIVHLIMLLAVSAFMNIYIVACLVIITETIVLAIRVYGIKKHDLW